MIKTESRCVGCPDRCIGRRCPNREVAVIYCDRCGDVVRESSVLGLSDADYADAVCETCLARRLDGNMEEEENDAKRM